MDRKKIILVGTNGNIGKNIVKYLIKHFQVYCIIRSPPTFGINSIFLRFIQGDAQDHNIWDEHLPGKDAVVSCFSTRQQESLQLNVVFTQLLASKMQEHGVKQLITFYEHGLIQSEGKYIFQSQNYQSKQKAEIQLRCLKILEVGNLSFTVICMWKLGESQKFVSVSQFKQQEASALGISNWIKEEIFQPKNTRLIVFLCNNQ